MLTVVFYLWRETSVCLKEANPSETDGLELI